MVKGIDGVLKVDLDELEGVAAGRPCPDCGWRAVICDEECCETAQLYCFRCLRVYRRCEPFEALLRNGEAISVGVIESRPMHLTWHQHYAERARARGENAA